MNGIYLVAALAAITSPATEVRGVQWFLEHPNERRAMLKQCDDNPGMFMSNPNCMNADAARDKAAAYRVIRRGY